MDNVRVAIAGIGNCASSLIQGIEYYRTRNASQRQGLMHESIGGWSASDIEVVAAFDIDRRKVGHPLEVAVFAEPNCARVFQSVLPPSGVDGFRWGRCSTGWPSTWRTTKTTRRSAPQLNPPWTWPLRCGHREPRCLSATCRSGRSRPFVTTPEPVLEAGVAMVNCVPVFLASNTEWANRFRSAGLPIIGDDIKSQVGATIVHRALGRLFADRGIELDRTYQLNTGGNTDFLNMLERTRLQSKKHSKTESVQSQLDERLDSHDIHIGPSDYVPWQDDNKIAFIRMEGRGFGDVPLELELRLSVQDSPNSAGVVIDAVRCAKLGLVRGSAGPLEAPSAWYMKSPPRQMRDDAALRSLESFLGSDGCSPTPARGSDPAPAPTSRARKVGVR